ncbi:MAG: acyl carrier protein [Syntrophorhabdus sp.]
MSNADADIIRGIISEVSEVDIREITDESEFTNHLGIDSMMMLEILALIEKRLDISILEADLVDAESMTFKRLMRIIQEVQFR